jgi:hypothetical protein
MAIYSPPAPPALKLLATVATVAGASALDLSAGFAAPFTNFLLIGSGLVGSATDGIQLRLAVGGVVDSGANYASVSNGTMGPFTGTGVRITPQMTVGGKGGSFEIYVTNAGSAALAKFIHGLAASDLGGAPYIGAYQGGVCTGCNLSWVAGSTFTAGGSVSLYGVGQ